MTQLHGRRDWRIMEDMMIDATPIQYQYPEVNESLLADVVARIRAVGTPERIVLFGSRGRGTARPHSDLDLLIIESSDADRYARAPRYLRALAGVFPQIDIVVWTPAEVAAWCGVPDAFVTTALREGRILYAQP